MKPTTTKPTTTKPTTTKPVHYADMTTPDGKCACGLTHTTTTYVASTIEDVTCKRCLKAMEATMEAIAEPQVPTFAPLFDAPEPVATVSKPVKAPKAVKAPKPVKPATVHLHDTDRTTSDGTSYGTWCKIPGQYTTNADEVTCKVCRAHIDGKAPLNAIPDRVKAARKAFRSFVARVAYMVYMDADCSVSGSWTIKHTNMAGDEYEINSYEGCKVDGKVVCYPLGKDIKQWMEDHWSCGEE